MPSGTGQGGTRLLAGRALPGLPGAVVQVIDMRVIPRRTRAFTLIELAVVVTLMATLVAAVTLVPRRWFRSAQIDQVIGQLAFLDQLARHHAMRIAAPVSLVYDLDRGDVGRVEPERPRRDRARWRLPEPFKIDRVATAQQQVSFGSVAIACSIDGHTPTYALRVVGPSDTQWLILSGLTGQRSTTRDENDVRELLNQLAP